MNTRGHWRFRVYTTSYEKEKLSFSELKSFLRNNQVKLRGWYFPHYTEEELTNHAGFCQSFSEVNAMYESLEFFRFFRSGQFIYLGTLREDAPNVRQDLKIKADEKALAFTRTIWTITEFLEFARRMAVGGIFEGMVNIEISLFGALNRRICNTDLNRSFNGTYICHNATVEIRKEAPIERILGESNVIAAEFVNELFHLFNLENIGMNVIDEVQKQLMERRF